MKKLRHYYIVVFLALAICIPAFSCTIVMYTGSDKVLAGSNEDSQFRLTKIWFTPGEGEHYSRVELGYDFGQNSVQGGMNEMGLFLDGNALGPQDWKADSTKPYAQGALFDTLLATCADLDDVKEYFNTYNVPALNNARIPFMDRSGASMVVEWYNGKVVFLETDESFQVATNFVKSGIEDKGVTCWRYNAAMDIIKKGEGEALNVVRDALKAAHQNFKDNKTVYSFICDLKSGDVFVYNLFDFGNPVIFNLHKEVADGYKEYYLGNVFEHTKRYKKFLASGIADMTEFGYRMQNLDVGIFFYRLHKVRYESEFGIEVKPSDLSSVAKLILEEGHPDRALSLYKINTEEFPENFKVWFDYAKSLENNEQIDEAINAYNKALEIRPWCLRAKRALMKLKV